MYGRNFYELMMIFVARQNNARRVRCPCDEVKESEKHGVNISEEFTEFTLNITLGIVRTTRRYSFYHKSFIIPIVLRLMILFVRSFFLKKSKKFNRKQIDSKSKCFKITVA